MVTALFREQDPEGVNGDGGADRELEQEKHSHDYREDTSPIAVLLACASTSLAHCVQNIQLSSLLKTYIAEAGFDMNPRSAFTDPASHQAFAIGRIFVKGPEL
jgi:hypothetical protein